MSEGTRMRLSALLTAVLALTIAGCEDSPADPGPSEAAQTGTVTAQSDTPPSADAAPTDVARSARELRAIPARFLGAWDYIQGNCNPASDLRMEIGPRRIVFYESVGDVTGIQAENDDAIVVAMSMSGEGDSWTQSTRFTLEDGGDRLIPTDADGDADYETMPRRRCAA